VRIEDKDAFGGMVNYTARVESCAMGAEIWISDRAKQDIDQEKATAHRSLCWSKHADCELKDFPGKHTLWSVAGSETDRVAHIGLELKTPSATLSNKIATGEFDVFI
jgi:class 3 adenylate cyclase